MLWGLNKPALARIFAGELAPGCSFLPPGLPGFDEAIRTNPGEPLVVGHDEEQVQ